MLWNANKNSSNGILGSLKLIWENRELILDILQKIQIVVKHLKNLMDDLADDGKLNNSNQS